MLLSPDMRRRRSLLAVAAYCVLGFVINYSLNHALICSYASGRIATAPGYTGSIIAIYL